MKNTIVVLVAMMIASQAFAQTPSTETRFLFNVKNLNTVVPNEAQIKKQIQFRVKKLVNGVSCVATSKLTFYSIDRAVQNSPSPIPSGDYVGSAIASVTSNCKETLELIVARWKKNPLFEVFDDSVVEPQPVVSGGNGN